MFLHEAPSGFGTYPKSIGVSRASSSQQITKSNFAVKEMSP